MKTLCGWLFFTALFTSAAFAQTAPTIASITSSQRVTQGQSLSLSVSVNGTAPFTYQWKKDGVAISGATNSTYAFAQVATTDTGSYTVTITNSGGTVVSGAILVDVAAATAPSFYYQPGPYIFTVGDTLSFSVGVSGTSPLTFVWKRDTTTLATGTSSSYSKAGATSSDAGSYTVTVSNIAGTISSPFTVTVNAVTAPVISSSPSSTTINPGSSASLYASVTNSNGVTYQWYKDGVAVPGATSYYYYPTEAGSYTVKATNSAGTTTSSAAVVTVRAAVAPTSVSISSGPVTVTTGESLSLYGSADGTSPVTYQWKKDGVILSGATSSSYFKSNVSAADAGTYTLVATNSVGSATSQGTVVSITSAQLPIITYHPSSRTVYPGDYISISVNATGTGSLSYVWKKDGAILPNSNTSSYTISSSIAASHAGVYTVTVSNAQGSVTSQPATVTVLAPEAPTIQTQPASVAVLPGESINLSVVATGRPNPTYQWKKDGVAISGAINSYYGKSSVAASDAGTYTVTVTNSAGSVTSSSATAAVGVVSAPVIISHPSSGSALLNQSISLSVEADNSAGATVQWYRDGVAITNATSFNYYISGAQPAHAGTYRATVTNSAGSATSKDAVWTVDLTSARPVITFASGSASYPGGSYAQVSVNVSSSVKIYTVVWKKDGVVVPNANSLYLSLAPFALTMEGTYTAAVTTDGNTYTGRPIELKLRDKGSSPAITRQPVSLTRLAGDYANFDVQVRGENPLTYQWYKDAVAIPSATASGYSLSGITSATAGNYTVAVTNRNGSVTSTVATLTVAASSTGGKPIFGVEPSSQTLTEGNYYLNLSASVLNSTYADTYQWYKDGVAIAGATSSSYYSNTSVTTSMAGKYQLKVTNAAGSSTSGEAIITVTKRATGPSFTTQPTARSGFTGGSVTFTAAASGNGTLSYQWRKDGSNIAGATGASLTLTNLQSSDAAAYTVVATDADGSTPSSVASLTVVAATAPAITSQPAPQISGLTGNVSFSVTATGSPAPTYQWRKNGNDIGGATGATLSLTNLVAGDAATYSVVVTNPAGTVTSSGASLIVYDQIPSAPAFTTQPQNRSATPGETVLLSVAVSGFPAPSLQWYKNGAAISGETGVTLSLGTMKPALAGQYHVVATNPIGTAQSVTATLAYLPSPFVGTYFGTLSSGEAWGLRVEEDGTATFLGMISGQGKIIYVQNVTVSPTGAFTFGQSASSTSIRAFALSSDEGREVQATSYAFTGLVTGQITGGAVAGQIAGVTGSFTGAQITGISAASGMAGTYNAIPLGSGLGEVHALAARDGTLLLVAVDGRGVRGGTGTVSSSGAFNVAQPQFTYSGNLAASAGTLSGTYQPTGGDPVVIAAPAPAGTAQEHLVNVSTRGMAGTESKTLIVGFVVSGSAPQDLLLRAVGPTLGTLGVPGFLANPRLKLYKGSTPVLENDDWMLGGAASQITAAGSRLGAYPMVNGSADAALLAHLDPGVYSAHVSTSDNSTGVTLMEVYDASIAGSMGAKIVNLSARGSVGTGDDVLIIGFVIDGTAPKKVLVRGLGPALGGAGVEGALGDPKLQLFRAGVKVNENDNWSSGADAVEVADAASKVGAFEIKTGTKDSALLVYLAPGVYSAHVSGVNNTTGIALVEVYEVP